MQALDWLYESRQLALDFRREAVPVIERLMNASASVRLTQLDYDEMNSMVSLLIRSSNHYNDGHAHLQWSLDEYGRLRNGPQSQSQAALALFNALEASSQQLRMTSELVE
ncbi:MAG: hypothetical protein LC667_10490, partial [Thioalkalivibrio sp.]|nr:hypothetical protein [Thioalkalivibrio sp.]